MRALGQAQCVYVSVKDVARALHVLDYLRSPLHGQLDDEVSTAYGEWYDSSGIDSFFGLRLSQVGDTPLVQVCPAEAWVKLQAQAAVDAEAQEGPVLGPTSSVPPVATVPEQVTIEPLGPPQGEAAPPPRALAGALGAGPLLLIGAAAGFGAWLIMRKIY